MGDVKRYYRCGTIEVYASMLGPVILQEWGRKIFSYMVYSKIKGIIQ